MITKNGITYNVKDFIDEISKNLNMNFNTKLVEDEHIIIDVLIISGLTEYCIFITSYGNIICYKMTGILIQGNIYYVNFNDFILSIEDINILKRMLKSKGPLVAGLDFVNNIKGVLYEMKKKSILIKNMVKENERLKKSYELYENFGLKLDIIQEKETIQKQKESLILAAKKLKLEKMELEKEKEKLKELQNINIEEILNF